jgi:hypothetical protein
MLVIGIACISKLLTTFYLVYKLIFVGAQFILHRRQF